MHQFAGSKFGNQPIVLYICTQQNYLPMRISSAYEAHQQRKR